MSAKNLDQKGRHRNKIVAFRVSTEEDALIERAVHLSGLTKQDFIIKRLQNKDIVVQGNPKVFKALKEELKGVMQSDMWKRCFLCHNMMLHAKSFRILIFP